MSTQAYRAPSLDHRAGEYKEWCIVNPYPVKVGVKGKNGARLQFRPNELDNPQFSCIKRSDELALLEKIRKRYGAFLRIINADEAPALEAMARKLGSVKLAWEEIYKEKLENPQAKYDLERRRHRLEQVLASRGVPFKPETPLEKLQAMHDDHSIVTRLPTEEARDEYLAAAENESESEPIRPLTKSEVNGQMTDVEEASMNREKAKLRASIKKNGQVPPPNAGVDFLRDMNEKSEIALQLKDKFGLKLNINQYELPDLRAKLAECEAA